jgi:putative phosphoesterase
VRVAALYDIHGNVPALESVLAELPGSDADLIVVGGDVVEGPQPVETLELLDAIAQPLVWVRGNCDRDPSDWVRERVGEERVAWLAGLPTTVTIDVDGVGATCFCHGSPRSDEDIVTAVSAAARVEPMLDGVGEALVVSGHTHVQFDRVLANHRLVNAGSVGMAYQGEGGWAYWTTFGPAVEPRRSAFDPDTLATALRESGYPNPEWFEPDSAENAAAAYEQMARDQH